MRLPRPIASAIALSLVTASCGDDSSTDTIKLDDDGLTPPVEAVQVGPGDADVLGLEYATFEGETATFDDLTGTPLVINFFAEWCPSCISEMPDFEEVSQELGDNVRFVGISIDARSESALQLVADTGVTYDVGWDPTESLYAHFRALAMPTTVFVDEYGAITEVWSGALSAAQLRDKINAEIL